VSALTGQGHRSIGRKHVFRRLKADIGPEARGLENGEPTEGGYHGQTTLP
jgi:hypothetical protein